MTNKYMNPSLHSIQFVVSRVMVPKLEQKCLNHTVSEYCSYMAARSISSHLWILHKSKLSVCNCHLYHPSTYVDTDRLNNFNSWLNSHFLVNYQCH